MKNSDKRIIKSFVVGNYIRLFNTNDKIYKCISFNKEHLSIGSLKEYDVKFKYLMNDIKTVKIDKSYPQDYKNKLSDVIREEKINPTKFSKVYYEFDDIDLNNMKSIIQYNDKCYILGKNGYDSETPYSLNQIKYNLNDNDDILSSYISNTYNIKYFNDSHIVNNKSVPIYDINYDSLKNVSFIKTKKPEYLIKFLNKYNLTSISSFVLFNSIDFKLDQNNFDSILISPLIDKIGEKQENSSFDFDKIFNDLFSLASKESFYRFFNPIGHIKTSKLNNSSTNDKNEYMYSFNLYENKINSNVSLNYFSLKNLKTPELNHDYHLTKIDNIISVSSPSYDFENNIIFNIFLKYKNIVIDSFEKFLDEHDVVKHSGSKIKNENLMKDLIDIFMLRYPKYDRKNVENQMNTFNDGKNHLDNKYVFMTYQEYILKKYNVNIDFNSYIIKYLDLINELHKIFKKFLASSIIYIYDNFNLYYDGKFDINGLDENDELLIRLSEIKYNKNIFSKRINETIDVFNDYYIKFIGAITSNLNDNSINLSNIVSYMNLLNFKRNLIKLNYSNNENNYKNIVLDKLIEKNIFCPGIYVENIKILLNDIKKIDSETYVKALDENPKFAENFKVRMAEKTDDFINSYNDMFKRENEFKLSGCLYGTRSYNSCFKSESNDLFMTYKYDTLYDLNFLNKKELLNNRIKQYRYSGIIDADLLYEKMNDIIYIFDYNHLIKILNAFFDKPYYQYFNKVEDVNEKYMNRIFSRHKFLYIKYMIHINGYDWKNSKYNNVKVYCISNYEYIMTSEFSTVDKYFMTLDRISNLQFVDRMKGEHYYKEYEKTKSNIVSLNVKNSGLTFITYTFDEVVDILCNVNDLSFDGSKFTDKNKNYHSISDIFNKSNFYKLIESENTYANELLPFKNTDDFKSFKYFKSNYSSSINERKIIKSKLQIRKTFEDSIRKSIHRYIPVNTTLWKIEYSSDSIENNEIIDKPKDLEPIPEPPNYNNYDNRYPNTGNIGSLNNPYRWDNWLSNPNGNHIKVRISEAYMYEGDDYKHYMSCIYVYLNANRMYRFGCTSEMQPNTCLYLFDFNRELKKIGGKQNFNIDGVNSSSYVNPSYLDYVPKESGWFIICCAFTKGWVYFSADIHCNISLSEPPENRNNNLIYKNVFYETDKSNNDNKVFFNGEYYLISIINEFNKNQWILSNEYPYTETSIKYVKCDDHFDVEIGEYLNKDNNEKFIVEEIVLKDSENEFKTN